MSSKGKDLTTLQRKFVVNLVTGKMSQREAYVKAGGTSKGDSSQDASASRILSNVKVRSFYDHLMDTRQNKAIATRERALEILTEFMECSDPLTDKKERMQAIKQLADLQAWNAPKQVEITGKNGGDIVISNIERTIVD